MTTVQANKCENRITMKCDYCGNPTLNYLVFGRECKDCSLQTFCSIDCANIWFNQRLLMVMV